MVPASTGVPSCWPVLSLPRAARQCGPPAGIPRCPRDGPIRGCYQGRRSNQGFSMAGQFKDKVVVVSGASRGIGKAIATGFAKEGAQTVLASSNAATLAETAKEIAKTGAPEPMTVAGDLRTLAGCERVFAKVSERFKRCDVLVNNAGATRAGSFGDLADDLWLDGFALKFLGGVRLSRLFWPLLKASQGKVIFIGGGAGRTPDSEFLIGASVNAPGGGFSESPSQLPPPHPLHITPPPPPPPPPTT